MSYIEFKGKVRLHFNRHGAFPLIWNIATDDVEIAVKSFMCEDVAIHTVYVQKETADEDDGKPSAWLETAHDVVVRIHNGRAILRAT